MTADAYASIVCQCIDSSGQPTRDLLRSSRTTLQSHFQSHCSMATATPSRHSLASSAYGPGASAQPKLERKLKELFSRSLPYLQRVFEILVQNLNVTRDQRLGLKRPYPL